MPPWLRNAPSAFQRLMERVLRGLNPEEGPGFVDAYIDDVLVFSQTLDKRLHHLSLVLNANKKAGLKLICPSANSSRERWSSSGILLLQKV